MMMVVVAATAARMGIPLRLPSRPPCGDSSNDSTATTVKPTTTTTPNTYTTTNLKHHTQDNTHNTKASTASGRSSRAQPVSLRGV